MSFLLTSSALVRWVVDCACYSKQRTKRTYLQVSSDKIQSYEKLAFKTTSFCPEHKLIIYFLPKPNKDLAFTHKSSYDTTSIAYIRESRFRKPRKFCLWNLESRSLESGILFTIGIKNPSSFDKTWNPKSTAWNPESKTVLDFLPFPYVQLITIQFVHELSSWTGTFPRRNPFYSMAV